MSGRGGNVPGPRKGQEASAPGPREQPLPGGDLVSAALADAIQRGWKEGAIANYPPWVAKAVAVEQLRLKDAGLGLPASADGNVTRLGRPGRASSAQRWMTSEELASEMDITPRRVRQLAASLGVGKKEAGAWWFTTDEAETIRGRRAA